MAAPSPKVSKYLVNNGRMPWYSAQGEPVSPYIIGIAGGSASGKTSVSQKIIKELKVPWVALVSMDSFYKSLTKQQIEAAHRNEHNFDHPNSFDYDLLFDVLAKLKTGMKVEVPVYDFATHSRLDKTTSIVGANVIIFEGIFALYDKRVREILDLKLFVDTDSDIRLARRLRRDISERGRDIKGVLDQYARFVKPSFDEFISPTAKYADVVVPRGLDNSAAIDLILKQIRRQLSEREIESRSALFHNECEAQISTNVRVLPNRPQLQHIHTIIRNKETTLHDFVFYAERLSRIVVEAGLRELPYEDIDIETPTNRIYKGKICKASICGVSIVRAGGSLESALRSVLNDVPIGKILIQTDEVKNEPTLHYCKVPQDISSRWIFLADAQLATGAAAIMAIRLLLDHQVPQEKIVFLALIASPSGLANVTKAFPKVKIVVSAIDREINDSFHILPGFGNFGDRYFGTV